MLIIRLARRGRLTVSTLGEKQKEFTLDVARLIQWAYQHGYQLSVGDCYRSPAAAKANADAGIGIANSLHTKRLAIDLNLFRDGEYLTHREDYEPLGVYWESLREGNCWGGRFSRPDSDHFSREHEGVR